MMSINEEITKLAVLVYRSKNSILPPNNFIPNLYFNDPILSSAQRYSMFIMQDNFFEQIFNADEDLMKLAPSTENENYAFFYTQYGGSRIDPRTFFSSLCGSAFMRMYFWNMEDNEGNFIISILKCFHEFKKAIKTKVIEMNIIHGISNIDINDNLEIKTPWGIIKKAPESIVQNVPFDRTRPISKCILIETVACPFFFDKSDQIDMDKFPKNITPNITLKLPFAFASENPNNPFVPTFNWTTYLLPFQTGFGISTYLQIPQNSKENNISNIKNEIEKWSYQIDKEYTNKIDLAVKRIITSVTQRTDPADSLIDAVMVWENILGPPTEVSFRITASMAKILESQSEKREETRKLLRKIYDTRSKVVHGSIRNEDEVRKYVNMAIGYAIKLLKISFEKGREWLEKDGEYRSNKILMDIN